MSEFVSDTNIHGPSTAEEDPRLLDLHGRYRRKWKLLTKEKTDRNTSQLNNRRQAGAKRRKDVILGNTNKMIDFRSNIKE
jgi:hypothetical protein